jgi:hypothetical protein
VTCRHGCKEKTNEIQENEDGARNKKLEKEMETRRDMRSRAQALSSDTITTRTISMYEQEQTRIKAIARKLREEETERRIILLKSIKLQVYNRMYI